MKLNRVLLLLCLLLGLLPCAIQGEGSETGISPADDQDNWPEPGQLADEGSGSDDSPKRPRKRPGGKRRRRLRKRIRTTTEPPLETQEDYRENLDSVEIFPEIPETPPEGPRRRPGKRRRKFRRPILEDEDEGQRQRRRRKGSRKRVRPVEDSTDIPEEMTTVQIETKEMSTPQDLFISTVSTLLAQVNDVKTREPQVKFKPYSTKSTPTSSTTRSNETFGNKIFDRKILFSKSRRLPVTSAIIRQKLFPRRNVTENVTKNEIPTLVKLIPKGFTAEPEVVEPMTMIAKMQTTEEPNYPKHQENELDRKDNQNEDQNVTDGTVEESKTEQITVPTEVKTEPEVNATNDSIVELMKTESGSMKLLQILESRNMTVAQLLAHRERGSSTFHLADIFKKTKAEAEESSNSSQIQFPEDKVLGSFPKLLNEQIEKMVQKEGREPRVFESLPEFPSTTEKAKIRVQNLKPVSVRGDFREVKITDVTERGPDVQILLVDETDNFIPHRTPSIFATFKRIPVTVKSAIVISAVILIFALFGFLTLFISCRIRSKKSRLRAKRDILCEHLQGDDFMASQQSLSPVLTKQRQREPQYHPQLPPNLSNPSNRHYYLWRTLRKKFQYD